MIAYYRRRKAQQKALEDASKPKVSVLDGLFKVMEYIEKPDRFARALPMLVKWINSYMDFENRGHVFESLQRLVMTGYSCSHPACAKDLVQVFEEFGKINVDLMEENPLVYILYQNIVKQHAMAHTADDGFQLVRM